MHLRTRINGQSQIQEVNIDTILITLYEAYEPVCRKKAIHLDLVLGEDSYPQPHTDQERLFQILSIFLDNAVSYSPENSSIEIQTRMGGKGIYFSCHRSWTRDCRKR